MEFSLGRSLFWIVWLLAYREKGLFTKTAADYLLKRNTVSPRLVEYLDQRERDVQTIARQAVKNLKNTCDWVETCNGNCSRHQCSPQIGDISTLKCKKVLSNIECTAPNNAPCSALRVSLSRSYIRLAPFPPSSNVGVTICTQRMLDPIFIKIWKDIPSLTAWAYFGSADGVMRTFPGREMNPDDCRHFDARKRPWYKAATSIFKEVVILLDSGFSMTRNLNYLTAGTIFEAATHIILELLDTLTIGDRVTVIKFDGLNGETIGTPVDISTTPDETIGKLKAAIKQAQPESTQGDASNFTIGTIAGMSSFKTGSLKILMVLTDGNFASKYDELDLEYATNEIITKDVLVFIYKLGKVIDGKADARVQSYLHDVACNVSGFFDSIDDAQDPLWAIHSYFNVLATLRFEVQQGPYWVPIYRDYDGLGSIISVACPAFDSENQLIGIAGIDILVDEVTELGTPDDFQAGLANRKGSYSLNIRRKSLPCPIEVYKRQDSRCPANPDWNGLCPQTDRETAYEEFVCCGNCLHQSSRLLSLKSLVAIIAGSLTGLLVLFIIGLCLYLRLWEKVGSIQEDEGSNISFSHQIADVNIDGSDQWSKPL